MKDQRTTIMLPKDLHIQIKYYCVGAGITVSEFMRQASKEKLNCTQSAETEEGNENKRSNTRA